MGTVGNYVDKVLNNFGDNLKTILYTVRGFFVNDFIHWDTLIKSIV